MADYTAIYKQAALSEHAIGSSEILPMQIIEFGYSTSGPRRICLSLGYIPNTKMLHCFRLNGLPLNHFRLLTKNFVNHELRTIYMKANKRDALVESLIVNKFKLPFTAVPHGQLQSFYASNFKNNRYMVKNEIYRTYKLSDMSAVTVFLPDLEFLGLIPRTDKINPTAEQIWKDR
jgi:hypothetical protein